MWVRRRGRSAGGRGGEVCGLHRAAGGGGAASAPLPLAPAAPRHPPLALLHASTAAACAVLLALCVIERVSLTAVAVFLLGYFGAIAAAGCNTALQLGSSDELRGRVLCLFTLIPGAFLPIAAP